MIWLREDLADKTQWLISLFCTFTDIIRGPDTLNSNHVGSVSNPSHLFSSHCDSHFCTITNCTYFLSSFLQMDLLPSCAVRWVDHSVQLKKKKSVINNPDFICYFTKLWSKLCKTLYVRIITHMILIKVQITCQIKSNHTTTLQTDWNIMFTQIFPECSPPCFPEGKAKDLCIPPAVSEGISL